MPYDINSTQLYVIQIINFVIINKEILYDKN
jgi:hypothetical protein